MPELQLLSPFVWVLHVVLQPWPGWKEPPALAGQQAGVGDLPHGPDSPQSTQRGEGMLDTF